MEDNNFLPDNNNGNNLLLLLINTFRLEGGLNPLLNNNNNLSSERLNPNVTALVNALMKINLIERYLLFKRRKLYQIYRIC